METTGIQTVQSSNFVAGEVPPPALGRREIRPFRRRAGLVMIIAGFLSLGAMQLARAGAAPSLTSRPPTLDPTFGLPLPKPNPQPTGPVPHWIWAATVANNQIIYLRDVVTLRSVPRNATLYATADDHLQLFINGVQAADTFKSPGQVWQRARKIAAAKFLHRGRNVIAIRAKNDAGAAGVAVWLMAGDKGLAVSNGQWRVSAGPLSGKGWTGKKFNDAPWPHATVEQRYGSGPWAMNVSPWPLTAAYMHHLYFQPLHVKALHGAGAFRGLASAAAALHGRALEMARPGYRGRSPLAPARKVHVVVKPAGADHPAELLLSFGQEVAGRIQVRGSGGAARIGTGESRGEAINQPWGGVHTLRLSAGQTVSTPYSAFRYATVSFTGTRPIVLNRLRLDFKYYPVKYRGAFACSEPLLTKIWYTGAYTAHLCMQEQIWDAPKRDRAMWMGDLQVSGNTIDNVFLDRFLMAKTMRLLRQQAQGGNPPNALPANDVNGIPGYTAAWIVGLSDFYRHTGDLSYLKTQAVALLTMLRYTKQAFNSKNIFDNAHNHWCFCDWAPNLSRNTPQAYVYTDLFDCLAVRRAADMLRDMGDRAAARHEFAWAKTLAAAARRHLANRKTHTFTNLKQVNAMAIYSGVADPRQRRAIEHKILGPHCGALKQLATPYGDNYVLFAMGDLGHTREGLHLVNKYWGGMIRQGATTFWEAYDPSWPKQHFHRHLQADGSTGYFVSLCHGWSTGATNWLTQYVLGVTPTRGGFAQVTITPHLGGLRWASGRVPTPHGAIVLRVVKKGSGEALRLTLPRGVAATIGITGRAPRVNGKRVKVMHQGRKHSTITLNRPGAYRITG